VSDKVKVFDEHTDREVTPGPDEVGLVAVGGRIPLGYWKDPDKTAATFRTVDGVRYSIPGDYASVDADGTIRLLGRGSACINTGGEKVYPEEVELLLREHPGVHDCVVVGVPDERFGEIVVALVQATDGDALDEDELRAFCRERTAGYKRPKWFLFVDDLQRSAAGKASYALLRSIASERIRGA
jgi:fatty-acyl-CoA synthase